MQADRVIRALSALAQEHRLAAFRLLVQAGEQGVAAGVLAEKLQVQFPEHQPQLPGPNARDAHSPRTIHNLTHWKITRSDQMHHLEESLTSTW